MFRKWLKRTFGATLSAAIIFFALQILPQLTSTPSGTTDNTVVSVVDGDTIKVQQNGEPVTVRLIGIDTPEIHHPTKPPGCFGPEAKTALESLVLHKQVRLEKDISDKDRYGRYLRYLWLGGTLVNDYLVKNGFAFSYRYPPDTKYQDLLDRDQETAKSQQIGLWSPYTCAGKTSN